MSEPKWLKDKDSWVLSEVFNDWSRKTRHPKVGQSIGTWTIIGAWINKHKTLMAYKIRCACGTEVDYANRTNIKFGKSARCRKCADTKSGETLASDSTRYFNETYGRERGEKLTALYRKRLERPRPNGRPGRKFHEPWKTDYKAFAKYLVALPGFDRHPELSLDAIDNAGIYEPGNLRFATRAEQQRNKKSTLTIEVNGTPIPLMEFIESVLGPEYAGTKAERFIRMRYYDREPADSILDLLSKDTKIWDPGPVKKYFFNRR